MLTLGTIEGGRRPMSTTGKTAAELQDLIMDGIRDKPECKDITGVVVASDEGYEGFNWRVIAVVRNGVEAASFGAANDVAARLRQQYHLVA
jgi:hypothetical protein